MKQLNKQMDSNYSKSTNQFAAATTTKRITTDK